MQLSAVIAALVLMCALGLCLLLASVLTFAYGQEPWNAKQYRKVGVLHAATTVLFALLFVIYYAITGHMDIWYTLAILPVFALLSRDKLRKANALQK